jgi:hypothetical protein
MLLILICYYTFYIFDNLLICLLTFYFYVIINLLYIKAIKNKAYNKGFYC